MSLVLEEIIWETTNHCNKNCDYCGSKDIICHDKNFSQQENLDIIEISRKIAEYPPNQITLSGGEPSLIPYAILKQVVDNIRNNPQQIDVKVKIITNGNLFEDKEKIELFDRIGLSINSSEDFIDTNSPSLMSSIDKITIITNFGKHNIWDVNYIFDYVLMSGVNCWQVQLTQDKDCTHQLPEEGIKMLREKLTKLQNDNPDIKIVWADNLQVQHTCSAGSRSCGILYNGNVIPCLSERSWKDNLVSEGNLHKDSLQNIWENGFKTIRFNRGLL